MIKMTVDGFSNATVKLLPDQVITPVFSFGGSGWEAS